MVYGKRQPRKPKNSLVVECRLRQFTQIRRRYERVLEANEELVGKIEELKQALGEACEHNRSLVSLTVDQQKRHLEEVNELRGLMVRINEGLIDTLRPIGSVSQGLIRQIQAINESNVVFKTSSLLNSVQPEESAEEIFKAKKDTRQTLNKALCDLIPIEEESVIHAFTPPGTALFRALSSSVKNVAGTPDKSLHVDKSMKSDTPKNGTDVDALINVALSLSIRNDDRQTIVQTPSPYSSFLKTKQRGLSNQLDPDQLQYDSTVVLSSGKELKNSDDSQKITNAIDAATSTPSLVQVKHERLSSSDDKENDSNRPQPPATTNSPQNVTVARRTRSRTKPNKKYDEIEVTTIQESEKTSTRVPSRGRPRTAKKSSKRSNTEP